MNSLKFYIDKLKDCDAHEVINSLRVNPVLSVEEKNLIYLYLFPRPLLDRQLPERIIAYRKNKNPQGSLQSDLGEIGLLVEAYRTEQYKRFMKHLFHSFTDPEQLFPIAGLGQCECAICGKNMYEEGAWSDLCSRFEYNQLEKEKKEYLAFGSKNSGINLCLDCIIQLKETSILLEEIEPGYLLDWRSRCKPALFV